MFLRRWFAVSFLLIFFSLCGCQSFLALAKAMGEDEETTAPRKLKHNERERKSDSLNEMPHDEEAKQSETKTKTKAPDDGFFRLVLNEKKGSFSLYFLADPVSMRYESLFNSSDPSASYITVYFDSNVYKLGSSKHFKTRLTRIDGAPAIVYESSFLILTQIFTPIRTSSSNVANGVMITLTAENIGTQMSSVGLRMLIDTDLGEGRRQVPFITNTQIISSELLLEGNSEERFWVSRGKNTALMGSIVSPFAGEDNENGPDAVHIANWKRLNDTPWKLRYMEGRSFNYIPNSIRDSAVCYYFGPSMLDRGDLLSYKIYLTTEDIAWYNLTAPLPVSTASILERSKASAAPEKTSRRQSSAAASSVQTQTQTPAAL
ncbi:MAG: hypothetical protein FWB95_01315, partial [Treponema sp.]|nr:hypothetical protein [Treponema sp.]